MRSKNVLATAATPPPCIMDRCERPILVKKRGLCSAHYWRWHRHGDPSGGRIPRGLSVQERFDYHVEKTDDHWLWKGPVLRHEEGQSYGILWTGERQVLAHRWSYLTMVGEIPEGMEIDHLCREARCVRPDHLEAVTHAVNVQRGNRWGKAYRRA